MIALRPLAVALAALVAPGIAQESAPGSPWSEAAAAAVGRAGENAAELRRALEAVAAEQRPALEFLVAHMPARDLRSLPAEFLLDDVRLAHEAWRDAPWSDSVPEDVFLDAILPYAHVTETREAWRASLRAICLPMIEGCSDPGEAAQRINQRLFAEVGVRYSTERRRADQSPSESIEQGKASCTGLSILLADACRSVGVPARLAGIASWPNKRGNHTWVEVWDGERWRFTGAAEYDPKGLDRAWFVGDAALATSDDPRHAIWAVVWRETGRRFPLAWARDVEVHAVDVTARYARAPATPVDHLRLMVDVRDGVDGPRVAAEVELVPEDGDPLSGTAKDEGADTNDHLEFAVPRGSTWTIRARFDGRTMEVPHTCRGETQESVTLHLERPVPGEEELRGAAAAFFAAEDGARKEVDFPPAADALVAADEERARAIVWEAYRGAPVHAALRADFDEKRVRTADREAPYTVKEVGERPAGGWPLFVAMHGGGGVPKRVNDGQWRGMQRYYREHPEVGGYLYVALRAPNDAWNGFYDDAIGPLFVELIRQFLLFGDVDPDKVFAMGYSHGGYGAFVVGPKIADRFAAVHASAAAPTPGETAARNFRNLTFTFMVGTRDTAYGRIERCDAFAKEIEALRRGDPDGFPVTYERIEGQGHGGLPDRDKVSAMYSAMRNPVPRALTWRPTDTRLEDHFWITVPSPRDGQQVDARLRDGVLDVATVDVDELTVWLDRRLVGAREAITVRRDGTATEVAIRPAARTLCESLLRRWDPQLAFPVRIDLPARDGR